MPFVPWSRTTAAQAFGEALAKFLAPASNGLIGSDNAPFGQDQLDIPRAEAEHMVQPDGVTDDLGGKAVAVMRVGRRLHAVSLVVRRAGRQTRLT